MFESSIPENIDTDQFQAMVGHVTSHLLTFSEQYLPSQPSHNHDLHLEVFIHKNKVKRVLVDGGVGLNICTLQLINHLGYLEDTIEKTKSTTIRAYDDQERLSQGIIALPIQVGPLIAETTCQVLDLDLPYNILLGQPWIHALKVVASTYH